LLKHWKYMPHLKKCLKFWLIVNAMRKIIKITSFLLKMPNSCFEVVISIMGLRHSIYTSFLPIFSMGSFINIVKQFWTTLSWVAKVVFNMRLLHVFALSKWLPWLARASAITLKTQQHAVNARWKRLSQLSWIDHFSLSQCFFLNKNVCAVVTKPLTPSHFNCVTSFMKHNVLRKSLFVNSLPICWIRYKNLCGNSKTN